MKVLSENRRIMSLVGLGIDTDVQVFTKLVPRKLVAVVFTLELLLGVVIGSLRIVSSYPKGPTELLFPVCLLLSCTSGLLVYIALVVERTEMGELFSYLQNVVNKSNARRCDSPRKRNSV